MNLTELKVTIQQEAEQCVKCGLCLPHCPTYQLTQNEAESPRGRIALMEGVAKDQLSASPTWRNYLDHCLTCRACEAVCPAEVTYGKLLDNTRTLIATPPSRLFKSVDFLLKHAKILRFFRGILRFYQVSGIQFLVQKLRILRIFKLERYDLYLPFLEKNRQWRSYYPARNKERGRVALFKGCATNFADQATLQAAIKILTACGYGVYVPHSQSCCGALHRHAGYSVSAQKFININAQAFAYSDITAIITVASGCGAELQENNFGVKVLDISQFLHDIAWPDSLQFKPLKKRVVLHTPCSLRNVMRQAHMVASLLEKIPEIELKIFSDKTSCCGAAGLYMLQHPAMADDLLEKVFTQVSLLNPDIIATSNIGCALHMTKKIRENFSKIKVLHPVNLLAAQLKES